MKGSRPLTDEQRKEADRLEGLAREASAAEKYGEAMRHMYQGIAVMNGAEWTPALEFAASLQAKADHAIVAPGQAVKINLKALYPSDRAAEEPLNASIVLRKAEGGGETVLGEPMRIRPAGAPFVLAAKIPSAASGEQFLEVRLSGAAGEVDQKSRASFVKAVPVKVENLAPAAERLRARLAAVKTNSTALPTAAYAIALYERADRGDVSPHRIDFAARFAAAETIADAAALGGDPFAGKHGDFHKAYRSAVDDTLQPYRVFIPSQYDGEKPLALVVALHGMGGDENSMFDSYAGAMKREAGRLGFIVVAPKGRESASMYMGTAEKDVMDVLAEVRRDYKVAANRIYLMGHSMGGYGTWSLAMKYPDIWAGLGPIAGGGMPGGMVKIKHIPQYVVHGDNDKTVPVSQSRMMVAAGQKAGVEIKYVEVPGGSHVDIAVPNIAPMFDFFAAHAKDAEAKAATTSAR